MTKTPLLAGFAAAAFALFVWAHQPDQPRGGVVLNRDPPAPPRSDLIWQLGALPEPMPPPVPKEGVPDQAAEEWTAEGVDPGVWAIPAEFSDID